MIIPSSEYKELSSNEGDQQKEIIESAKDKGLNKGKLIIFLFIYDIKSTFMIQDT